MFFPEKPPHIEQKEKPKVLYHGSPNGAIEEFEPRDRSSRDLNEGPVIFATPDKADALKHLFLSHDAWTQMGRTNGVHYILIAQDKETFCKNDTGGTMYTLPSDSFIDDPKYRGSAKEEWTSRERVKPISKEDLPSSLEALITNDVQVYFVDPAVLIEFRDAPDKVAVLKQHTSENQLRGDHIRSFDDSR